MIRIRTAETAEDLERVCRLTADTFGREASDEIHALMRLAFAQCPFLTPDLCFIVDVDGEIAASCQVLPLEMQVGDAVVRAGGIQAIAGDPRFRNRHYVKRLFDEGRAALISTGFDFSLGFGHPRYYDRLGATPIVGDTEIVVRTRDVRGEKPEGFREVGLGDVEVLLSHYARENAGRTGVIRRSPEYWAWMRRKPPHIRIRDDGYVGYEIRERDVIVLEINGQGPRFYQDALSEVAGVAVSAGLDEIRVEAPPDHPFVESVLSFGVEVTTRYNRTGWCMGEILNVTSFFGKLEGELASRLRRALPASPGVDLVILVGEQTAELALPGTDGERHSIDLALPRKLLTQLAVGYKGVDAVLYEAGADMDAEKRQVLRALFPKGHPWIWRPDRF